jgi:CheY-like chemotaxis protein
MVPMHATIRPVRHKVRHDSKALIVDDSKVVRVMFKRMLEARGLGETASGQEAIVTTIR